MSLKFRLLPLRYIPFCRLTTELDRKCGARGWVYISSHGVGYDIPSLRARCVPFPRSASTFSAELQDAMADDESESREGAAMTQDQFALLMGAFSASQARMEERFAEFRAERQEDAAAKAGTR